MALVRGLVVLMLVVAGLCFAMYAGTGEPRYKKLGLIVLKWTLVAAFAFFAGLIFERVFLSG
jgi:hypothetical protein